MINEQDTRHRSTRKDMRNMLEWNEFNANGLQGLETFLDDDTSMHVVKYEKGVGFYWLIRRWDENNKCHVTGSYDFPGFEDGWQFLSDAYRSLVAFAETEGIMPAPIAQEAVKPSSIKRFLQKAVMTGMAALVSLTAIMGAATPSIAYADEMPTLGGDVVVELADGQVGVYQIGAENLDAATYSVLQSGDHFSVAEDEGALASSFADIMEANSYENTSEQMEACWLEGTGTLVLYDASGNMVEVTNPDMVSVLAEHVPAGESVSIVKTVLGPESTRQVKNDIYEDGILDETWTAGDIVGQGQMDAAVSFAGGSFLVVALVGGGLIVRSMLSRG